MGVFWKKKTTTKHPIGEAENKQTNKQRKKQNKTKHNKTKKKKSKQTDKNLH